MQIEEIDNSGNPVNVSWLRENAYFNLVTYFQMKPDVANTFLQGLSSKDLRSLWDIYTNSLRELLEATSGNFSMVKDIISHEHNNYKNRERRVYAKFQAAGNDGKAISIPVNPQQRSSILFIKHDLIFDLIEPLQFNLTREYQKRHAAENFLAQLFETGKLPAANVNPQAELTSHQDSSALAYVELATLILFLAFIANKLHQILGYGCCFRSTLFRDKNLHPKKTDDENTKLLPKKTDDENTKLLQDDVRVSVISRK
jgi:hypothetical protein